MFLSREQLDDTAKNSQDRIRRHNFYSKNGFIDLPFRTRTGSIVFNVMSTSKEIVHSDYDSLARNWAGKLVLLFVKIKSLE